MDRADHPVDAPDAPDAHRLPDGIAPREYRWRLRIDPDADTFGGGVAIDLEVERPTSVITLHAVDLRIAAVTLTAAGTAFAVTDLRTDPEREWISIELRDELPPGPAVLSIEYEGDFGDKLVGLYRSTLVENGEERNLVVSQFESTHARRALPCFDEPAHKATFSIAAEVPEHLLAVSNSAELGREATGSGTALVTFADTPVMSTYLLALVVGPLEATEARQVTGRDRDIPLRVVHPNGRGDLAAFALEVAQAALVFFEGYYDLPYPGDKVDLVAVPDFAFGAMENLGCITFREVLLLVDPDGATPRELQRVADVINHELAHMWFGDLVTMRWWNGIWLNEAFATFMEVSATDAFRPEWDVWTAFGLARAAAFETDALVSTRPIEYEVVTAADAEGMFDILTYEKGASVVRMLEQYLGPDGFRDGIRAYLRRHAWGNTETTDLWDALEETTGEPVRRIMDEWIFRGGHPLVTAELTDDGVRLDQRRALAEPERRALAEPHGDAGAAGDRFPVPMVVEGAGADSAPHGGTGPTERVLLDGPVALDLGGPLEWVQPNLGGNGFFRTLLDVRGRDGLARAGRPALERFVLLDDLWFAARAGHVPPDEALETVALVVEEGEDDPSVWRRIAGICAELVRFRGESGRNDASTWVRSLLVEPRSGHPVDAPTGGRAAEVAGTLLATAANSGDDASAIGAARELFEATDVSPAVAAAALDVVARHATVEEHAEIERRWRTATTPQDEQRHLSALVATDDPVLMRRALDIVADDVRSQDAPYVMRRGLANPTLGPATWEFLVARWAELTGRFPAGSVPRMLEGIRTFTDRTLATRVGAVLDADPVPTGARQVDQHVEAMWATVATAERFRETIGDLT